jgi:hypothetical protein
MVTTLHGSHRAHIPQPCWLLQMLHQGLRRDRSTIDAAAMQRWFLLVGGGGLDVPGVAACPHTSVGPKTLGIR